MSDEAASINKVLVPDELTLERDEIEQLLLDLYEVDPDASRRLFVFMLRKSGFGG